MTDISIMALTLGAGVLLGAIFYGGLWYTVRNGLTSTYAPLWFIGSFWLRLAIVVGGFYVAMQGDWKNLLLCFAGFLLGRALVSVLVREKPCAT